MKTNRALYFISFASLVNDNGGLISGFAPTSPISRDRSVTQLYGSFLNEEPFPRTRREKSSSSVLSAVSVTSKPELSLRTLTSEAEQTPALPPVLSAAMLVTASTIGASCLVLPTTIAGPGMAAGTGLFITGFVMHLFSGLIIAEVAIKQHEDSGNDVPSSFKEFANETLQNSMAANIISITSLFCNFCVMAFDLKKAGSVGSNIFDSVDPAMASIGFSAIIASLVLTQSSKKLANVASMTVFVLFVSFAGILIPGLGQVHDPVATMFDTQTSDDLFGAIIKASPIIVQAGVYQNIVPSVTKILNYDRQKVVSAIFLGCLLPTIMFIAWSFAVLGGGINIEGAGGLCLSVFSVAAVCGSSLGCTMSLSEELDQWMGMLPSSSLAKNDENDIVLNFEPESDAVDMSSDRTFSWLTVMLAVSIPLAAGLSGQEDISAWFLALAGAYGTPLLYGAIPVAMAWSQRQKFPLAQNLIPTASLGMIGTGSLAFVWEECSKDLSGLLPL